MGPCSLHPLALESQGGPGKVNPEAPPGAAPVTAAMDVCWVGSALSPAEWFCLIPTSLPCVGGRVFCGREVLSIKTQQACSWARQMPDVWPQTPCDPGLESQDWARTKTQRMVNGHAGWGRSVQWEQVRDLHRTGEGGVGPQPLLALSEWAVPWEAPGRLWSWRCWELVPSAPPTDTSGLLCALPNPRPQDTQHPGPFSTATGLKVGHHAAQRLSLTIKIQTQSSGSHSVL